MKLVQRLLYVNESGKGVRIILEPWAEQFDIAPGARVEIFVHAHGEVANGILELEQLEEGLIIYGYEGCVVNLKSDGVDLPSIKQI
ncbi:hypothetical protein M5C99_00760 [Acidovorax sp. NCPPB 2350]|nr:hypothetical protein M5C99_00760 [Acidovorax sp. NCPPB 2350]